MFEANPPVGSERCFDKARILPSCRPRRRHAARLQYSTIITRYAKVRQRFARAARKARVQRVAKETIPVKEGHSTISCAAHPLADTGIEDSYLLMHSRRCTSQIKSSSPPPGSVHGKLRFAECGVAFARASLGVGGISGH